MYLIIGANGFLGSYIVKNVLEKTNDHVIATARDISNVNENPRIRWIACDISNYEDVKKLSEITKDESELKVVVLAAYHNPDLVEKNPKVAWNINVTSLSYLINELENVRCLYYPSTDSVYGNSVDGYRYKESDGLNPVNTYGKQKCAAESVVLWHGYNVARFPFLIAPSCTPVKKHFYDVIVETIQSGKEMEMFTDSYRSSMNFDTAASLLVDLMEQYDEKQPKVINICGDDALSKYDVGKMIAEKLKVDPSLIRPVSVAGTEGIFEAKRAQSTLMDNTKLKQVLGLCEIKLEL